MEVRAEHPRIWLTPEKLKRLRGEVEGLSLRELRVLSGRSTIGRALIYAITGEREVGREAVDAVMSQSRFGGQRSLLETALCYDWCRGLLARREEEVFRERLLRSAKAAVEFGRLWRSFANEMYAAGWRVGLAALTLHGEHPYAQTALDFVLREWEDALKVLNNIYPDGSWGEGYNYNHHTANNALRFFLALRGATGVDLAGNCNYLRNNGYYIIYGVKPNGLIYPGDDNDHPAINWFERDALLMANEVFRNPHYQYFLNHCPFMRFQFDDRNKWRDLLWYDASIPESPIEELPLSRLFKGDGLVIARSGWNWDRPRGRCDDTWVTFRCGRYLSDHCHLDNNHFEIYHRGELAIDSGRYDCDWGLEADPAAVRASQFFSYYKRSIAHNTVLVHDPDEKMEMGVLNDGGQKEMIRVNGVRNVPEDYEQGVYPSDDGTGTCDWVTNPGRWDLGRITGYLSTADFTYVCGDATESYSADKVREFTRVFLYIRPDLVVVFDRVESSKAEFRKTWLLHSIDEPQMLAEHGEFQVEYGEGRLVCLPVLPVDCRAEKIGGPGNEFLAAGVPLALGGSTGGPVALNYGEIPGAWRMELSPPRPAERDYFLNVLLMSEAGTSTTTAVEILSEEADSVTVAVAVPHGAEATITFAKSGPPSGHLHLVKDGGAAFDGDLADEVVREAEGGV
jgi:hypothetical protein